MQHLGRILILMKINALKKELDGDTARPRRQHPHLFDQPISRPFPAGARRRTHRHPAGDAAWQYAPEPAGTWSRNEIFRKTALGIRHRHERADFGFPSTEVSWTERLRLHHSADVPDDFRHLQSRQYSGLQRFSLLMGAGNAVCGSSAIGTVSPTVQADNKAGISITIVNLDRYRADDCPTAFGRLPVWQRHAAHLRQWVAPSNRSAKSLPPPNSSMTKSSPWQPSSS